MPSNVVRTCIPCRFSAKQTDKCPYCHEPMTYMGKDFKPPRKDNDSQWKKVERMVGHGIVFGYCKCHRPRRPLKTVSDVKNMYKQRRSEKRNYAELGVREKQIHQRKLWRGRLDS